MNISYDGPETLMVRADSGQMRQVLWNLLRNAIQASEAHAEVTVNLVASDDGGVTLSVHDRGVGIDRDRWH